LAIPLTVSLIYALVLILPDQTVEAVRSVNEGSWWSIGSYSLWLLLTAYLCGVLAIYVVAVHGDHGLFGSRARRAMLGLIVIIPPAASTYVVFAASDKYAEARIAGSGKISSFFWQLLDPGSAFLLLTAFAAFMVMGFILSPPKDSEDPKVTSYDPVLLSFTYWMAGICLIWVIIPATIVDFLWGGSWDPPAFIWLSIWAFVLLALLQGCSYVNNHYRWPLLTLLAVFAMIWSVVGLNDNHVLASQRSPAQPPPLADQAFQTWLGDHQPVQKDGRVTAVVVAAEGGGSRAAYMTALVLETMRAGCSRFQDRLFAVIGVSGGSLGAALASAAAANASPPAKTPDCTVTPTTVSTTPAIKAAGADLLRPLLRGTLLVDPIFRILPVGLADYIATIGGIGANTYYYWVGWLTDRARYLERGVELAWSEAGAAKPLGPLSFSGTGPATRPDLPFLVLLTTDVASGRRVAFSQLRIGKALVPTSPCRTQGSLALDTPEAKAQMLTTADILPDYDPGLVAAAITSARFAWVTPAATMPCNGSSWRLVDGGYFENSGLTTAFELIGAMAAGAAKAGRGVDVLLVRVENHEATTGVQTRAGTEVPDPPGWLGELVSPVRTFLGTRDARADLARRTADRAAASGSWCDVDNHCVGFTQSVIALHPCKVAIPLGWALSPRARQEIADQVLLADHASAAVDDCGPQARPVRQPSQGQLPDLAAKFTRLP
jgi:hypothetical protein